MLHKMKLNESPFERMKNGTKTIEFRIYDEKRGKYVGSHVHLNVTYLLEADENEEIHIKEDENSGVKWVPIDEVLNTTSEVWVRDRVYAKIIDKMKNDGII